MNTSKKIIWFIIIICTTLIAYSILKLEKNSYNFILALFAFYFLQKSVIILKKENLSYKELPKYYLIPFYTNCNKD